MKSRTLLLAGIGMLVFGFTQMTWAHAVPKQLIPAVDAKVSLSPKEVHIVFSETLEPAFSSMIVTNSSGHQVNMVKSAMDVHDKKQMVAVLPPLSTGRYTVQWSAVALDGHRTHGEYHFTIK